MKAEKAYKVKSIGIAIAFSLSAVSVPISAASASVITWDDELHVVQFDPNVTNKVLLGRFLQDGTVAEENLIETNAIAISDGLIRSSAYNALDSKAYLIAGDNSGENNCYSGGPGFSISAGQLYVSETAGTSKSITNLGTISGGSVCYARALAIGANGNAFLIGTNSYGIWKIWDFDLSTRVATNVKAVIANGGSVDVTGASSFISAFAFNSFDSNFYINVVDNSNPGGAAGFFQIDVTSGISTFIVTPNMPTSGMRDFTFDSEGNIYRYASSTLKMESLANFKISGDTPNSIAYTVTNGFISAAPMYFIPVGGGSGGGTGGGTGGGGTDPGTGGGTGAGSGSG